MIGDTYEFLISNYAANACKSGGEFFTSQHVSKLIAQLAMHKQTSVNKIYDPACGSGSLLLQAKKHFDAHIIDACCLFNKETYSNLLLDAHIDQIMQVFDSKANVEHFAQFIPVKRSPPAITTCL